MTNESKVNDIEISIIVPVYNVEKYIRECIDSILEQTFSNFELILVDDGSTDHSAYICDEYNNLDKRITVIHKENGGLSSARNAGLDIARGRFITFIDSDDFIDKEFCKSMLKKMVDSNADIVICDFVRFESIPIILEKNSAKTNEKYLDGLVACEELYSDKAVKFTIVCGKVYKSDLFKNLRFPLGKIHEDEFLIHKLYYYSKKIIEIPNQFYYYRIHYNSITMQRFSIKRYDAIEALDQRISFFKEKKETNLENLTISRRKLLIAEYSLKARKMRIYKFVPMEYKISFFSSIKILRNMLSNAEFEYTIAQYYPLIATFNSIMNKIMRR